jgi:hypothetical protein
MSEASRRDTVVEQQMTLPSYRTYDAAGGGGRRNLTDESATRNIIQRSASLNTFGYRPPNVWDP